MDCKKNTYDENIEIKIRDELLREELHDLSPLNGSYFKSTAEEKYIQKSCWYLPAMTIPFSNSEQAQQ